ncbi:histo-blood group ABO system transferase-like [Ornithorhynchus anatinus]|uniref:histo-blood group ABO system transferase-like n=1 Tax=Ornithorhynchus anatinus TaxID=9258 RepID=UPI0019D49D57|nr:histo-blood group ABO system transferase-like [Ornithorhynchus anatinus]
MRAAGDLRGKLSCCSKRWLGVMLLMSAFFGFLRSMNVPYLDGHNFELQLHLQRKVPEEQSDYQEITLLRTEARDLNSLQEIRLLSSINTIVLDDLRITKLPRPLGFMLHIFKVRKIDWLGKENATLVTKGEMCRNCNCFSFPYMSASNSPHVSLTLMIYPKAEVLKPPRTDVLVMTPWFAPIIWEGTYNIDILNEQFKQRNVTVGLTVFAIKKYVVFLKLFLETAEKHFMVGHKVNYYIYTDRPADVPAVPLREGRKVVVLEVQNYARWQDVSMRRMEMISHFAQQRFLREVGYLVCVDVDMRFSDRVGVEILSSLFGTLHPGFYGAERRSFTYERRPLSRAYIPPDEGDFYYAGGFFGGTVSEVYELTKECHQAMMADKGNKIEAVWHDESYLNKYLLYHKPTKILSPEYLWDENLLGGRAFLKKKRFLAVPKNHAAIRNR